MNPQPWHTLTPDQQRWAWQQYYAEQTLVAHRAQADRSKRITGNVLWLVLGFPGLIVVLLVLAYTLERALT